MLKKTFSGLLFFFTFLSVITGQSIVINEIVSSNNQHSDEDNDFPDWIEIYNPSTAPVNLLNYSLSDDGTNPLRWRFPSVDIAPKGFIVVWCSGKDRATPGALHTNFSLSSSGEQIILTHSSGSTLEQLSLPPLRTNISYGRKADGSTTWFYFDTPTPGQFNTSATYNGIVQDPLFSHGSGFYTTAFSLTASTTDPNARIVYTRDASTPVASSPVFPAALNIASRQGIPNGISMIPTNHSDVGPPYYEGWQTPVGEVFKTNVIRAQAFREGYIPSNIVTHTYLVDPQGGNRYGLPVAFINTDNEHFFDPETGIYTPGNMWSEGPEWERPVHFELFEVDRSQSWAGDMGVRIHGNTTRSRPRRSLRLYAREEYGDSWMDYRLFPTKSVFQYKRFLLRNSGNDWDQSIFRDGFMQFLARDMNVETQYFRPAVVFLNGEYWGIHGIRDRFDQHYIYSHYGLEENEMTIMENNAVYTHGNPDGVEHYNNMYNYIATKGVASTANYNHVKTLMDVESFIDFQIAHIYSMNTDWPGNNTSYFRRNIPEYLPDAPAGLDGRWRWMIRDMDFGFWLDFHYVPGVEQGAAHNTLAMAADPNGSSWPNPSWSTRILRRMLLNTEFKNNFINRFADLLNSNYKDKNVLAVLDSIYAALEPEMQEHINRWRRPATLTEWNQNIERMRTFASQRTDYQRKHIQSFFGLSGQVTVNLSINQNQMGGIRINTIEPDVSAGWSGIYFKGIPLTVTAIPSKGYRFSHWSGGSTSTLPEITLTPSASISLTAHFEPDPTFQGDELNPPAHKLINGNYSFTWWDETQKEGTFPPNMLFLQSSTSDPLLSDEMTQRYNIPVGEYAEDDQLYIGFPYMTTARSRINGLGEEGISFINTGRTRDVGAAVLALDTRGIAAKDIQVEWTAATQIPNAKAYAIRLQYKIGVDGTFKDFTTPEGTIIEYLRSDIAGHQQQLGPVTLPQEAGNQEYVQLRWKYYYTGVQLSGGNTRRDMLRLDNIYVKALTTSTGEDLSPELAQWPVMQIFPNPARRTTTITFSLTHNTEAEIALYDYSGRKRLEISRNNYSPGVHSIEANLQHLEPGVYVCRLNSNGISLTKRIIILN